MKRELKQYMVTETGEIKVSEKDERKFMHLWENEYILYFDENNTVYTESGLKVGDILSTNFDVTNPYYERPFSDEID